MSNSLQPHGLQHIRLSCPSLFPKVSSNSCPLSDNAVYLILCHRLFPLPSVFPSIRAFSSKLVLHIKWLKCWSFSFSTSPSNVYSGLISFRIDWFALLAVQSNLKSILQQHNSKASILWCSSFFMVQLSHLYTTIGKTIALTIWTFVD